jgi:predicted outer membrane repeat protein
VTGGVPQPAGGCLAASGDTNSFYGEGGIARRGTAADHRAPLLLERVVFSDCVLAVATGGALVGSLVNLLVSDSLLLGSSVPGGSAGGGAAGFVDSSEARFVRTTFAGNSAAFAGGAVRATGSLLEVHGGAFLDNAIPLGAITTSRGSAIFTGPFEAAPKQSSARGIVEGALFSGGAGLPVFENDRSSQPVDATVYDNNRFFGSTFGSLIFSNPLSGRQGSTVDQLNALVLARSDGAPTDKSTVANQLLFSRPAFGALVAAPSRPLAVGPDAAAEPARLGFAWSGNQAALGGSGLSARRGLVAAAGPGSFTLTVDGTAAATAQVKSPTP